MVQLVKVEEQHVSLGTAITQCSLLASLGLQSRPPSTAQCPPAGGCLRSSAAGDPEMRCQGSAAAPLHPWGLSVARDSVFTPFSDSGHSLQSLEGAPAPGPLAVP